MLRSIYRGSSIYHERLRNPTELWIAAGGRLNRKRQRRISSLAEVFSLHWEPIDLHRGILRVEENKTGERLELPPIRQLAAALALPGLHAPFACRLGAPKYNPESQQFQVGDWEAVVKATGATSKDPAIVFRRSGQRENR